MECSKITYNGIRYIIAYGKGKQNTSVEQGPDEDSLCQGGTSPTTSADFTATHDCRASCRVMLKMKPGEVHKGLQVVCL